MNYEQEEKFRITAKKGNPVAVIYSGVHSLISPRQSCYNPAMPHAAHKGSNKQENGVKVCERNF